MATVQLLRLMLFCCSVGEVCSQTFPYVSFMGQTLANHSYVNLSLVGDYYHYGRVQCHTDLSTCCRYTNGPHRGDWYFPNGNRLPFPGDIGDIFESREAQRVDVRRNKSATSPVGIYRCGIPTVAVHDDDISVRDAPIYMGLYIGSGGRFLPHLFTHS